MGITNLFKFIKSKSQYPKSIHIKDLKGKIIAIDSSNVIYKTILSMKMGKKNNYYFNILQGENNFSLLIYKIFIRSCI